MGGAFVFSEEQKRVSHGRLAIPSLLGPEEHLGTGKGWTVVLMMQDE